jgi:hypothetical protein
MLILKHGAQKMATDVITPGCPLDDDFPHSIDSFCSWFKTGRSSTYQAINAGRLKAHKRGKSTIIFHRNGKAYHRRLPEYKVSTNDAP